MDGNAQTGNENNGSCFNEYNKIYKKMKDDENLFSLVNESGKETKQSLS